MDVDLCFVMDCTSSMSGHIAGAKDCILKVTDEVKGMEKVKSIRFGFCGYRDHCDGPDRLQLSDSFTDCFTNSSVEFRNFIGTVEAKGGGDSPEDVLGGLNAAVTRMGWRSEVRILIHVGDCPPHGRHFHNLDDNNPDGDPNGLTEEGVLKDLTSKNIQYSFGKITSKTDTMIRIFRDIIGEFQVFKLDDAAELVNKFKDVTTAETIKYAISLYE